MTNAKGANKQFRHNHYVTRWYQRRFLVPGQTRYHYLDLRPDRVKVPTSKGTRTYKRNETLHWGPKKCFAETDLYTMKWKDLLNTYPEQFFFGEVDRDGRDAVEHFANFSGKGINREAFHALLRFMSVQKLRTPKGLGFLSAILKNDQKNYVLSRLRELQTMYCAIWTECIWQIADASKSCTKFIISDHPVTVYNRACFPKSQYCQGFNDPDIRIVATHTYFPLSLDKVLILTNLSWVRDPYQSPLNIRPNPDLFRTGVFNFEDVQTERYLIENEVLQINFITKQRALRYIAAAEPDWLYPEKRLKSIHWRKLGNGYLLMPEPRNVSMGGLTIFGFEDGTSEAFDPYGHKPWQKGYEDSHRKEREWNSLERFKAEWAFMQGPDYRGIKQNFSSNRRLPFRSDTEEMYQRFLEIDARYRRRPGERKRRRQLRMNEA